LCKRFGAKEIVLAVGYKAEQIMDYFGSGKKLGVKLHYNVEKEFLGTAGALKFSEEYFASEEKFLMLNGDECKDVDFAALNAVFERNHATAAIALAPVDYTQAGGIVKTNGELITNFDEKPEGEQQGSKLINAGAYILSNEILAEIPAKQKVSIEKETFPALVAKKKAFALPCVSQFFQTDTFERWEKAIFGWKGFEKK
jgi:mannose-1-phosphate guanylyltransferase